MKKELRFCIEYVCPTHPLNDDGSVNVRHFRTLSEEEAENALVLLLECGCKLIDLYRGNVQDGKLAEWSPLPMIVNQNEDFYVDGDFDSYPNKDNMAKAYKAGETATIDKACEWLEKKACLYLWMNCEQGEHGIHKTMLEDFREAMKGE